MTTPRNRQKTPQLGFWDEEVSTPDHDQIQMWVYRNPQIILRVLYPLDYDRGWQQQDAHVYRGAKRFSPEQWEVITRTKRPAMHAMITLEKPLLGAGNRYLGYIDLYMEAFIAHLVKSDEDVQQIENTLAQKGKIYIEVKTSTPNLGELMRQINLYRSAEAGMNFVVVSPDDRFADVLEEQGIRFIKYQAIQSE